jgi:hypothetical protein
MAFLYLFGVIGLAIILLLAQDSKKETTKERFGDAVGQFAQMTANTVEDVAHSITEPAYKKKIRLAREDLASRNDSIFRYKSSSGKEYLNQLLTVDDYFKASLKTLGLSEERWQIIAHKLLYIGTICQLSRDSFDYTQKNSKSIRENIAYERRKDFYLKDTVDLLYKSLDYFNIPIDEWVEYGYTVVEMHNLADSKDLKEFGDIVAIMPTKNNRRLL